MSANTELNIKLNNFDGPLDLLSALIHSKKINIKDVNMLEIIEQYVMFVENNISTIKIDEAVEYLNMATYLLEMKSKALLPNEEIINGSSFEYERDKMIQRILEYDKYKEASKKIEEKIISRNHMFSKDRQELNEFADQIFTNNEKLPNSISPETLSKMYQQVIEKYKFKLLTSKNVQIKEINIEKVENDFFLFISEKKSIDFMQYIKHISANQDFCQQYIVVFFNAILEMTKNGKITLSQDHDDISISLLNNNELVNL
jgi:segregation and condensation protein A